MPPGLDIPGQLATRWIDRALDAVFPASCVLCDNLLPPENHSGICDDCRDGLIPIHPPFCRVCGTPFQEGETSRACLDCQRNPPRFDMLRVPYGYGGPLRDALLKFKFRRVTRYARPLAGLLLSAAGLGIDWRDYDLAVPVPLHPARLRERGFNQALLLGRRALSGTGLRFRYDVLERIKPTAPQVGLSPPKRRENVRGAFKVRDKKEVAGKRILLIDDVVTTGATMSACAKALKRAGASGVDAAAVARPLRFDSE